MKINAVDYLDFLEENINQLSKNRIPLWHPLGFVSCLISSKKGDYDIRVHYWPSGNRRTKNPNWPIHTHSYSLSSLVLAGSVRDIQYRVQNGNDHSAYKVNYFEGGSEIVKTEKTITLSECINRVQTAGSQYHVERGVFHQSQVEFNERAVTLVALSEMSNDAPLVLGTDAETRYPYERLPFDNDIFWNEVSDALTSLKLINRTYYR
jgi:hypothetical protein